ncbi:hypothetical protein [Desertivirga xinjiangensis]|uniref:hypothetical protein n=1 Tax=Desertivirga xinjiangensis TaxID=539206 RepID=UPI002109D00A|nr:hypothetical protein [Pedobacter xinjiangensis]
MKHPDNIIPENQQGAKSDNSSSITLSSPEEALNHFQLCRDRLLRVSQWHSLAGQASASFTLTDASGRQIDRQLQKGDFFKIDIPAPGSDSGEGFDWVQVEAVEEDVNENENWEYILVKVCPASNPETPDRSTSHFFDENANSYFLIKRVNQTVTAEVHGRNELPNTDTETLKDKIRNTVIAIGAMIGISSAQWKSLTEGLISKEED